MPAPTRRKGDEASTPQSRALAAQFTIEYCDELLRMNPAGLEKLLAIAQGRVKKTRTHRGNKLVTVP